MTILRVKTTMRRVQKKIAPYVTKHVFGRDTVDSKDIEKIACMLMGLYNNVSISMDLDQENNGKPWMKITVKSFPFSKDKILGVTSIPEEKKKKDTRLHGQRTIFLHILTGGKSE